jgi:UDP-N-acetylmuramyl tripeptide synthase
MILDLIAINLAKSSAYLVKNLRLGNASALPGRIALALKPKLLKNFTKQLKNSKHAYMITGTNGKTTTTGLLKQICIEDQKNSNNNPYLICNDMGANLYYGIVAELVHSSDISGLLKSQNYTLEVDEAAFVKVSKEIKAKSIIVTNIFRDQLDRFGELDSTQKLICTGIDNATKDNQEKLQLILNANDARVSQIPEHLTTKPEKIFYYSVIEKDFEDLDGKSETKTKGDFICEIIESHDDISHVKFMVDQKEILVDIALPGTYNIYNATAAAAAAYYQCISLENIKKGIENYHSIFGRSETKKINNKELKIFLIKNPTGCTEVIKHLCKTTVEDYLIIINDDYADGKDISWLWDARFDYLAKSSNAKNFLCSGHRAYDMAVRLKYAGVDSSRIKVITDIKQALENIIQGKAQTINILPTYTALLELEKLI